MLFHADEPRPGTGGDVTLLANGRIIGSGRIPRTVGLVFTSYAGMDIGRDNGGVVDLAYEDRAPYAFTGTIDKVTFDLKPQAIDDQQAIHKADAQGDVAHGAAG
jgi:arylsulfatase